VRKVIPPEGRFHNKKPVNFADFHFLWHLLDCHDEVLLFQSNFHPGGDQGPRLPDLGQLLFIRAFEAGRVFERALQALIHTRPDGRAILVGIVADGDQVLE
jgi:hypothetical protein